MRTVLLLFWFVLLAFMNVFAQPKPHCIDEYSEWNTLPKGVIAGYTTFGAKELDSLPFIGHLIHVDTEPEVLEGGKIIYPFDRKRRTSPAQATLMFVLLVNDEGRCVESFVSCSQGRTEPLSEDDFREFESSVAEALRKTRFKPAIVLGKPVYCWMKQHVIFQVK